MSIRLDPGSLFVTTFEPVPGKTDERTCTAASTEPYPVTPACGADTVEHVCLKLTLLAEDCFGPTAGCPLDTAEECAFGTHDEKCV